MMSTGSPAATTVVATMAGATALTGETDDPITDSATDKTETEMNKLYILLFLPLLCVACRSNVISSDHRDVPEGGWAINDTVQLSLQVEDTAQVCDLALVLRHSDAYPYQNAWFFLSSPDLLCPLQCDTVQAFLADDRGRWLGTRAGRYYNGFVFVRHELRFPEPGTYRFAIVHGMRDSVINGLADVGLELRIHEYGKE